MHGHRDESGTDASATPYDSNTAHASARRGEETFASCERHYRAIFRDTPYYSSGRQWSDYVPAYRYGHVAHAEYRGHSFEEVEQELAGHWDALKDGSHLAWTEARGAVRDIWRHLDDAQPGDRDRHRHRIP